jgi:hypothetical protein
MCTFRKYTTLVQTDLFVVMFWSGHHFAGAVEPLHWYADVDVVHVFDITVWRQLPHPDLYEGCHCECTRGELNAWNCSHSRTSCDFTNTPYLLKDKFWKSCETKLQILEHLNYIWIWSAHLFVLWKPNPRKEYTDIILSSCNWYV